MKQFEVYIELLFSLLGGGVHVAVSALDKYLWIVVKTCRLSVISLAASIILIILSELSGASALLALSVLLVGVVVAVWSVLVTPMVLVVELGSQWEPVRRQLRTLGFVIIAAAAFAFLALRLPGGFDGVSILVSLFVLFLGFAAFGFRPTRTTLGIQMVLTALFSIFAIVFPQTSGLLGSVAGALDTEISRRLSPKPAELEMSLSVLTGQREGVPPLFKWYDGSPNWWCRSDDISEAGYRCFSQPGRDQITQVELLPITPEIVQTAVLNLREFDRLKVEQAEAERLKRESSAAEEAKHQQEQEARQLAEEEEQARLAYIAKYVALSTASDTALWAIFGDSGNNNADVSELLNGVVENYRPFLRDAAFADGVFDRLMTGDPIELEKLGLQQLAPILVLGRMTERGENLSTLRSGRRSTRTLTITLIDTLTNFVVKSETFTVEALGQNETLALQRSLTQLREELSTFVHLNGTELRAD